MIRNINRSICPGFEWHYHKPVVLNRGCTAAHGQGILVIAEFFPLPLPIALVSALATALGLMAFKTKHLCKFRVLVEIRTPDAEQ
jgi:hypothetical protein